MNAEINPRSVYIAFEVFPRPKGASSHIEAMIRALALDHGPVLVICCGSVDMPAWQFENEIIIHRFRALHPNLLKRAEEFGGFVQEALMGLPKEPDLCVFRDPWGGWPAVDTLTTAALIFEVNGLPSWELPYTYPSISANPALLAKIEDVERHCLFSADAVITISHLTRAALIERGAAADSVSVIPNSAAEVFFHPETVDHAFRYLDHGRWFGYFGSLHPWQGIELLIEAWARVANSWPEVRLLIVHSSRGESLKRLKKKITKLDLLGQVFLQSAVTSDRLASALIRLEFTAAPLTETFRNTFQGCCPVKIVESMAAGTPVLAADLEVCRALIEHGLDGWLVRPDDPRLWALAIDRLLSDGQLRQALATGAATTARNRFTRTAMFAKLKRVFDLAQGAPVVRVSS